MAVYPPTVLPDGRLASGDDQDGKITLWRTDGTSNPEKVSMLPDPGGISTLSLALLADGRLASGSNDGKIKLWPKDFAGEPVVLTQDSQVTSLAVLADGRLASSGFDNKVRLWIVDEEALTSALCLRAGHNLSKDEWARYIASDTPWKPSWRDRTSNWRTPDQGSRH